MGDWETVNQVWGAVEGNLPSLGQLIVLRLFKDHPETKDYFPKFKSQSLAQLEKDEDVKAQGITVMKALGEIVKLRGNHSSKVKALAATHIHKHKVKPENFTLISQVIVAVLTEKYPGNMTAPVQQAFATVLCAVCTDLETEYKLANFQG
ncbi:myoglobin [Rhinoraja longicauda]